MSFRIPYLLILFFCLSLMSMAQSTRYIIRLKDKNNSPYSIDRPAEFLSPAALERRLKYNIRIDETDIPINSSYLNGILGVGNVKILNQSKWFNQVLIQTADPLTLQKILDLPYVYSFATIAPRRTQRSRVVEKFEQMDPRIPVALQRQQNTTGNYFNYGNAYPQINIHHGEILHNKGYRGQGMKVAMFDAGYFGFRDNPAFDSALERNRIIATYDLVDGGNKVEEDDLHGMYCLSIMLSNMPGKLVGTAPEASYWLFRTEDATSEYPVEEQNWVAAAEMADSIGIDLITSSLGYTQFNDPLYDHSYPDMDGNTTLITRGADMAVKKGMIVTNSAGNSGNDPWRFIAAPADGDSVLAVGAVNADGVPASFSSYGPAADGRVKPDVTSVGWGTIVSWTDGQVFPGNGTSFSNPNLAGLITCLWQAFPEFSNMEILQAVKQSAHLYKSPDVQMGYGIPNFEVAYNYLTGLREERIDNILKEQWIKAYPVPFKDNLTLLIKVPENGKATLQLLDATGRIIQTFSSTVVKDSYLQLQPFSHLSSLPRGVYFIRYTDGSHTETLRVMK